MTRARILIVEDEGVVALDLSQRLTRLGYEVVATASTGERALELYAEHDLDVVLMDVRLGKGLDGITAATRMRREEDPPEVVFLTAQGDDETLARAREARPAGYLLKPFDEGSLRTTLEMAIHARKAERARTRAEFDSRRSRARLRNLAQMAPVGILMVGPSSELLYANALAHEMGLVTGSPPRLSSEIQERAPNFSARSSFKILDRDGRERWLLGQLHPDQAEGGDAEGVIACFTDVTEVRRAQERLLSERRRLASVLDRIPDAVVVTSARGELLFASQGFSRLTGFEESQIRSFTRTAVLPPEILEVMSQRSRRILDGEQLPPHQYHLHLPTRDPITVEATSTAISYQEQAALLTVIRDVTERARLEEQVLQTQRMEALGELSGAIAHDFNNLLFGIRASAQALSLDPDDPEGDAILNDVLSACDRGKHLVQQLLEFGWNDEDKRSRALHQESSDIVEQVRRLEPMLRRIAGKDVSFEVETPSLSAPISLDASRLDRILLNLILNARDALLERKGTIRVSVRSSDTNAEKLCELEVSDTGVGIPPEDLFRIWEPHFTSKRTTGGHGLGLATVYGMVKRAGGRVEAESEPGLGSRVRVLLPRLSPHPNAALPSAQREIPRPPLEGITVALAEDDDIIRRALVKLLTRAGCRVLVAADGREALERFRSREIDVLLSDLVMPHLGGAELAQQLCQTQPGLPVVLMTGYSREALDLDGTRSVLQKPIEQSELLRTLTLALDSRPS